MDKRLRYLAKRPKAYGKMAAAPNNLRVRIDGRHDLEGISLALQKMVARLQEQGAESVQGCSIYLEPLDGQGGRRALRDEKGHPVEVLEIGLPKIAA